MQRSYRTEGGFTLPELLVALAIVSLLTALAVPSYQGYVLRSALQDSVNVLATYQQRMDAAYDGNGNYGVAACAVTAPTATARWTYSCTLLSSGQGFRATATGAGVAAGHAYTLDNLGNRGTTSWAGATVAKSCWLIRGTEC